MRRDRTANILFQRMEPDLLQLSCMDDFQEHSDHLLIFLPQVQQVWISTPNLKQQYQQVRQRRKKLLKEIQKQPQSIL